MEISLATLAVATPQQVADHIARGLLRQRFQRSMDESHAHCRYRGHQGRKCAGGHCITDAEYAELEARHPQSIEGQGWDALVSGRAVPPAHQALISAFQKVHDISTEPRLMLSQVRSVMRRYSLSTTVLANAERRLLKSPQPAPDRNFDQ